MVHRQTACAAIKHMALGVNGFGCEDALTHLMNFVWPNVFETSPHLVQAFMDAVDGMRVALGPMKVLSYVLQVSFLVKVQKFYTRVSKSMFFLLNFELDLNAIVHNFKFVVKKSCSKTFPFRLKIPRMLNLLV